MSKVTIVVPVYNVERYLERCIESLITQTYFNVEIVLVNDGSTDMSGVICDQYATWDERIIVIHQHNRGAAAARNAGMERASGEYLLFVDGDDWIEATMVERLLQAIEVSCTDIAICEFTDEYIGESQEHSYLHAVGSFTSEEIVQEMLIHWEYLASCCKLYSKRVLKNVRWEEGHCIDDEFFTYKTFILAQNVVLISDKLYHYRQRQSGAMRNEGKREKRLEDQIAFVTQRYGSLCDRFPMQKGKITEHLLMVLISVLRNAGNCRRVSTHARKELLKYTALNILNPAIKTDIRITAVKYLLKNASKTEMLHEEATQWSNKGLFE